MMAAAVAGSNSISEQFTAAASQPHFAWALVFTALAVAFVLFSLGYGKGCSRLSQDAHCALWRKHLPIRQGGRVDAADFISLGPI